MWIIFKATEKVIHFLNKLLIDGNIINLIKRSKKLRNTTLNAETLNTSLNSETSWMSKELPFQNALDRLASEEGSRKTIIKGIHLGKKRNCHYLQKKNSIQKQMYFYTPARNSHLQKYKILMEITTKYIQSLNIKWLHNTVQDGAKVGL